MGTTISNIELVQDLKVLSIASLMAGAVGSLYPP